MGGARALNMANLESVTHRIKSVPEESYTEGDHIPWKRALCNSLRTIIVFFATMRTIIL